MKDKLKSRAESESASSQFNLKDGKTHQLGRSERNLQKYEAKRARKNADRGTLSFSSGK